MEERIMSNIRETELALRQIRQLEVLNGNEKENRTPNLNKYGSLNDRVHNLSVQSSITNSGTSQAIAGAMRALQIKVSALEQENLILKECLRGAQSR